MGGAADGGGRGGGAGMMKKEMAPHTPSMSDVLAMHSVTAATAFGRSPPGIANWMGGRRERGASPASTPTSVPSRPSAPPRRQPSSLTLMQPSTASSAASHALVSTPASLAADLAFIATLSAEHLGAFCAAARQLLRTPDDVSMFAKASRMLGVDTATVSASVRALCHVLGNAATAGRAADDVLHGFDLELPPESLQVLTTFYDEMRTELEQELRRGLDLPHYRSLEWRLQVRLGGRYAPRQAPAPSVLMRLHTEGGAYGAGAEHLLQADLTSMRRLTSELEAALAEDKSTHSRRIGRRV